MEPSIVKLLSEDKVAGLKQVNRGISDNQIRCVLIAANAEEHIRRELVESCLRAGIPYHVVPSKEELGRLLGLDVNCATVGILKTE